MGGGHTRVSRSPGWAPTHEVAMTLNSWSFWLRLPSDEITKLANHAQLVLHSEIKNGEWGRLVDMYENIIKKPIILNANKILV